MLVSEAKRFLQEKREQGYMTQEMLVDAFANGDWIDDDFFHGGLCYFIPESKPFEFHCGIDAFNQLNKVFEDFYESEMEKERKIRLN